MISKVLAILLCMAACSPCLAKQEETIAQLMAKADSASGAQRADLSMQVAEREMKLAIDAFKQNRSSDGRAALEQIATYSEKGRSAAVQSGKQLKHTEIKLRQISEHLRDLKFNTEPDDQTVVQTTIDKLESYRTELLNRMFGSKKQ